jgi:hypothetical protein
LIKLKTLKEDSLQHDGTSRLIFDGLNPTPLRVRDTIRKLCTFNPSETKGTLTEYAQKHGFDEKYVTVKLNATLADWECSRLKNETKRQMITGNPKSMARFDAIVGKTSIELKGYEAPQMAFDLTDEK